MRLKKVRVQNYRSIIDTEEFDVEKDKTILVGPNEAGKSAVLQALQQINRPPGVKKFDALRDYPRSKYNDISSGRVKPSEVNVVEVEFSVDDETDIIPDTWTDVTYKFTRKLDNTATHQLIGAPAIPSWNDLQKDLTRLAAHVDARVPTVGEGEQQPEKPSVALAKLAPKIPAFRLTAEQSKPISDWLTKVTPLVDEGNETEEQRLDRLTQSCGLAALHDQVLTKLDKRKPVFVLFNNYFRVRPLIHLRHLAERIEGNLLDDDQYDYGNSCLLKLLGFSARELSDLGQAQDPNKNDPASLQAYRDQLDQRQYQLNAAEVMLTSEIRQIWAPDQKRGDADKLRIRADGQYLKVVVEDDLGVEIELDQRSEGFQWLVSFFVVFFAEAQNEHKNAILLLDEPGLSLHALKQREFRKTISRLAEKNQTLYTTHSPFLVGPDELELVRVVEMENRQVGTKVHTTITAKDPAALLPLQEALGYDLAQSLFTQKKNLVLEGLTDYWYVEAVSGLLRDSGGADLDEKIALVPANTAGKVVYFATILHAQGLKVATLLDSDAAGETAATQDTLVHILGNKRILRTKDFETSGIKAPEIEDLLRVTLIEIAKTELGIDVASTAAAQPTRPLVDILSAASKDFSKYRLAKAFIRWTRANDASALTATERDQWQKLIGAINSALK